MQASDHLLIRLGLLRKYLQNTEAIHKRSLLFDTRHTMFQLFHNSQLNLHHLGLAELEIQPHDILLFLFF